MMKLCFDKHFKVFGLEQPNSDNKLYTGRWKYHKSKALKSDGKGNLGGRGVKRPEFVFDELQANGGTTDFSNSNHALNIGAGIYGAMEGLTSSQGYWLGKNGKYYEGFSGRGPNQYTGSRASALKSANTYKLAGKAVVLGQVALGGYMTYEGYVADGGEFGYNAQRAAVGSAAGIGFGLAGAQAGAAAGAAIGAFFGGVGAVPGAVIGGVIGGFGFGVGGSYLGSYLGESAVDYYHGR
ncbi:MAG: hypothetical protein RIM99_19695 [Cyclobacteriaceae bacterium]